MPLENKNAIICGAGGTPSTPRPLASADAAGERDMTQQQPAAKLIATAFGTYDAPTHWAQARRGLRDAHDTYWLATTRPDGTPHVRPVLSVWVDERLHFVSGSATRKTRHLVANPQVTIAVTGDGIDLVVEGR